MSEFEPTTTPSRLQRISKLVGQAISGLGNWGSPYTLGSLHRPFPEISSEEEGIRRDWQAVGNDLQAAINDIEQRPFIKEDK
jgi:hypothetical protein